jgi:3-oxoacyl-[acyl-carrier-protein] synthase-1
MSAAADGIVVIGLGACTAVGNDVVSTAAAIRAGISNAAEHPSMTDEEDEPMIVSAAPFLDPELSGAERLLALAVPAAREAMAPLLPLKSLLPVTVVVGLAEPRPGLPEQLDGKIRDALGAALQEHCRVTAIRAAATGHAGGLLAIRHAAELVASGKAAWCLAGGVDSWLEPATLEWLDETERLHSETTRWGFCPGEAAGFCLIGSASEAARLGLAPGASVLSTGSATEANRIMTDTVCIGEGLTAACREALAGLPPETTVDHAISDLNGEPYRGDEYGFMMTRLGRRFGEEAGFETPAQSWGDVGAASGPLFLMLASIAARKGYSPGPLTLLYAGSDSGRRAAALIRTVEARP